MKFVVVDGLRETRLEYKHEILEACPGAEVFQCMSAEDALFVTMDVEADLIISSEILSFRSAFELVRVLNKMRVGIPVIVVANDDSNALQAIKNNVFDYLITPLSENQLQNSIHEAIRFIDTKLKRKRVKKFEKNQKLRLNTTKGYMLIDLDKLAFCRAEGAYTYLSYTDGKNNFSSYTLGRVEEILSEYHFIRINRSEVVNLKMIKSVDKTNGVCFIDAGVEKYKFKISRGYLKKLEAESLI